MKRNYPSVSLSIDKSKKRSDECYPLFIKISWRGTRASESTGIYITEKDFNRGSYKTNRGLKKRLADIDTTIFELMQEKRDFTAKDCLGVVDNKLRPDNILREMSSVKKYEWGTVRSYLIAISSLKKYFGDDFLLSDLTLHQIQGFARATRVSPTTMCGYLKRLSALLTYCKERGYLKDNVMEKWKFKSEGYKAKDKPKTRTRADLTYFINIFETTKDKGIKEAIGIWLAGYFFNGLALTDLVRVDWDNIRCIHINDDWYYSFKVNRKKTREVANIMCPKFKTTESLIELLKTRPWDGVQFRSFDTRVANNLKKVDETLTYYQCRHTFCSMMVQSGQSINTIASMMGRSVNGISAYVQRITEEDTLSRAADALKKTEIMETPNFFDD